MLAGDVVSVETRAPIPFAVVTLKPFQGSGDKALSEQRVLSDSAGRWVFRNLPAGPYAITAAAAGFLEGGVGQRQAGGASQTVMAGDRQLCMESGLDDYVAKPVSVDQLRKLMERWLTPAGAGD